MADDFKYDVFLSHSSKDNTVVLAVAERLRADGLRVWFDEWEFKFLDSKAMRAAKIEEGLEPSRVLVLCMSAHASAPSGRSLHPIGSAANEMSLARNTTAQLCLHPPVALAVLATRT